MSFMLFKIGLVHFLRVIADIKDNYLYLYLKYVQGALHYESLLFISAKNETHTA